MRSIKRKTPEGIQENWKLKAVSYNSKGSVFIGFIKIDSDDEFIITLDEREAGELIKFCKEIEI